MIARTKTASRGIPAVLYLRASSDKQETSVPDQRTALERFGPENGYSIVAEYVDDGISGDATDKRHDFQRMIRDAAGGTFKAILVWDQDRFGRFDSIEAGYWIHPLIKADVRLHSIAQGEIDWSDFAGRMIYQIQQEAKHTFLRDLSRNSLRGKAAKARAGIWMGPTPFGYEANADRRLVLGDPAEVGLVRRIFADYLAGRSTRGIADRLNGEGVPSPSGGQWRDGVIHKLLVNRAYRGDFVWNRLHKGKYNRVSDGAVQPGTKPGPADESDRILIEAHHEAIIDPQTFDRVQAALRERKRFSTPKRDGGGFLLTGLVRCARCGAAMVGNNGRGVISYLCHGYVSRGRSVCVRNAVRQDELVDALTRTIQRQYLDPDTLAKLREELRFQALRTANRENVERLRKQLVTVEGKLGKAAKRLVEVEDDLLPVVKDQVRELRSRQEQLTAALKAAETPQAKLLAEADRRIELAMEGVERLLQAFREADPLKVREHLRTAIEAVEVKGEPDPSLPWNRSRLVAGTVVFKGGFASKLPLPSRYRRHLRTPLLLPAA